MTSLTARGTCYALVVLLLQVSAPGCGGGPQRGNLQGKVTFNGTPLTTGTVILFGPDGEPVSIAQIRKDGAYSFPQMAVGSFKVGVECPPPRGAPGGSPIPNLPDEPELKEELELAKNYVPIPLKYKNSAQSGLSAEIKSGTTIYDIALGK